MNSSDDDIVFTESGDNDTGSGSSGEEFQRVDTAASLRALEDEGISIVEDEKYSASQGSQDQLSRDLFKEEGVEILSNDEDESFS